MTSQQVDFANGHCLVEIERHALNAQFPMYVARMSVVEEQGSIVRPLVSPEGQRVRIKATSERLALRSAVSYLEGRFGEILAAERSSSLGAAAIGHPFRLDA